jgi:glyoxylase-like metal-dependent hydrolase (beta-lactamase superfamily II)
MQATVAIYGEEATRRIYGEVKPVPRDRIVETPDNAAVHLAGREFRFFDTPGHARHHVVVHDGGSGHVFAGDTFGISYRELDIDGRQFVFPTTSPSQFDPEPLHRSIERIVSLDPAAIYVTHFSRILEVRRLSADLHRLVDAHAELGLRHRAAKGRCRKIP